MRIGITVLRFPTIRQAVTQSRILMEHQPDMKLPQFRHHLLE